MLGWLLAKLARAPSANRSLPSQDDVGTSPAPSEPSGPLELYRAGRADEAASEMDVRLTANPSDVEGLLVKGLLALDRGKSTEAQVVLVRAGELEPARADVQVALGRVHVALDRHTDAKAAFERALELDPGNAEGSLRLALLALARGGEEEALRLLSAAVASDPRLAEAHFHLGNMLLGRGRLDDAERHYRRAVDSRPGFAEALANLGSLMKDRGRNAEAIRLLDEALRLRPALAPASFNLAMLRIDQRRWAEAATLLRSSLAADPRQADAQYWLGNALMGIGEAAEARNAYRSAIGLQGDYSQARWGYAMAQLPAVPQSDAEQNEAVASFSREITKLIESFRDPRSVADGFRAVGAQQPYYLAYIAQNHRRALADYGSLCVRLLSAWARTVGVPPPARIPGAKYRLGIVSAHIHSHSVWHALVRGWVEFLDPARFELHLFHTGATTDTETQWASRRVAKLHHGARDWTAWAKTVSDGQLDALIYPEIGMDATAVRLAALRLARVQLASWGHPITTGLPTIDGFISAESLEPPDAASHYTESLIALPRLGCCYQPFGVSPTAVDLASFGIGAEDRILLCAGTPFKYAPRYDALLADVARRCRPCKLVFFRSEPEALAALLERRLRASFEGAGISFDDSVRFIPWQTQAAFFGLLDRADVFLDSVGFSGFNTAMQAIERATPVVAWEGDFMRGRFASGILRHAGLDEWIADSEQGYAERVERLCADRDLREQVRRKITERRSSLFGDKATLTAMAERLAALLSAD